MKKFYEKVLPSEGVYCVSGINSSGVTKNKFAESLDDFLNLIEGFKAENQNVFFNPASLINHSRKNDNALYLKSFFIDLDVGSEKQYTTQDEAFEALAKFIVDTGIVEPTVISSGRGVHAYWIFNENVAVEDWKPYAEKFKAFCMEYGLGIDPVVTAHQTRIMRCPDTLNYKTDPPTKTAVLSDEVESYDFTYFKSFLGEVEPSLNDILKAVPKGMDDDTAAFKKLDNYSTLFETIAIKSLEDRGCNQIKEAIVNPNGIDYGQWTAALSVAIFCDDGEEAIHKISEDYEGYDREATIQKANEWESPRTCEWYSANFPKHCEGCQHRGKINTPIVLGRELKIAVQATPSKTTEGAVREETRTKALPSALEPFVMGENGGIYMIERGKYDKKNDAYGEDKIVMVSRYNVYPIKRIFSPMDGEILIVRAELPNDAAREFHLPMKHVYASEKFKEIMASNGIMFTAGPNGAQYLMSYFVKWGDYMITKSAAEIMRLQMGWTDSRDAFVVGPKEIRKSGEVVNSPTSPLCREVAKHLNTSGTYQQWQALANNLNTEGFEYHAFVLLSGFGSVLMPFTSTSGATICLMGGSGNAKTGALYAALSIWGNPKNLSAVQDQATGNGLVGRYLALHNLPFGLDEVSNIEPKLLSKLVHSISHGKAKIRMQSSVNAEREHEASASLISIMTSNQSLYDKLGMLKKDPNGEVARLIEFNVPKPKLLEDFPSQGRAMFNPFNYNYGWAGPEFIKALFTYKEEEILEIIERWVQRFKKDFGDDTTYRFYENVLAADLAAGEIANRADIIQIDLERIYDFIVHQMIIIRDKVVRVNNIDYEALVGDFLNRNQTSILSLKNGQVVMDPRGPLMIRSVIDQNRLMISRPEFNKYLAECQVSQREFAFTMEKKGILIGQRKIRMGSGWKDATSEVNVACYEFDTSKFDKVVINDEDEKAAA